jgi:peptidoglycan hydrolase-like protein with peptidoglycan-binding domain
MTLTNKVVAKLAVAFVAISMMFFTVAPAQAQTVAELQAMIDSLMAQIESLSAQIGGSSSSTVCPYTWSRSLSQGSTGADVMALQQFLNGSADTQVAAAGSAGSAGMETSYYGPATAAAVSNFQVKYRTDILAPVGLVNPTGYFGPSTMAKANSLCATAGTGTGTGTGTGSDALEGGAGYIDEAKFISALNNEEVGEGTDDVEVMGLGVVPENSDIALTAVKVTFDVAEGGDNGNSASRLNKYADEVSLWLDGEEIARADAGDFTKSSSGVYYNTFSLNSGAIIRDGDMGDLVVAVSGLRNLDSNDVGEEWGVRVDSIRYKDAQGAIISDSTTLDMGVYRIFSFVSFANATDLGLKVRSGDADVNTARTIEVSSTTKKNDVALLSFEVEVEGGSDLNVDEMVVNATTTNTTIDNVVSTAYLYMDGKKVGSESIASTTSSITFDDLDLDLDAGEKYEFVVKVDFKKATGGFTSGTTIDVDVLSTDVDNNWVVEDEKGDNVGTSDRSGSASSDAHTLVTAGVNIALGSTSAVEVVDANSTAGNYGKFTMEVKVTAVGETIYVKETAASSTVAVSTHGLAYVFENTSGAQVATASSTSGSFSHKSGGTVDGSSIRIGEGQTATFEFVGTYDPTSAGQMRTRVVGIGYGTTNTGTGSSQSATPVNDFRSGNVFINN